MLKKLRHRFILSAMAAITLVIVLLLCAVLLLTSRLTSARLDQTLESIVEETDRTPDLDRPFAPPMDGPMFQPFDKNAPKARLAALHFSIYCDADGNLLRFEDKAYFEITQEQAEQYSQEILKKKKDSGYYGDYRYLKKITPEGYSLYFLNAANELQIHRFILFGSSIVAAVSLLLICLLITLFSGQAIKPFARNMELQKRFVTDAGHEIKTPLTSIITSTDVLASELGDNEWIGNIQQQSLRLSRLVNNLVTLSRLDEATPFPDKTVFSLSDLAWETAEGFQAVCKAKEKQFVQHIEDDLLLYGDGNSIQQMISILLDNAVKYSDERGMIRLNIYKKHKNTVIEVFNTCRSIDPSEIRYFFDRFYRSADSRSGEINGTGIGLSIAKSTVEGHGGKISAESTDGRSICFRVIL